MSGFPSLAEAINTHLGVWRVFSSDEQQQDFCADLADAWREACTITTVEQLDALPPDTIVRLGVGVAAQKRDGLDWFMANDEGYEFSSEMIAMNDYALPALLIWHPDWARP